MDILSSIKIPVLCRSYVLDDNDDVLGDLMGLDNENILVDDTSSKSFKFRDSEVLSSFTKETISSTINKLHDVIDILKGELAEKNLFIRT